MEIKCVQNFYVFVSLENLPRYALPFTRNGNVHFMALTVSIECFLQHKKKKKKCTSIYEMHINAYLQ